jgi:hypothetical protein
VFLQLSAWAASVYREALLDRQPNVVVSRKVHRKLHVLDRSGIDNICRKVDKFAVGQRWCGASYRYGTRVIKLPLPKGYQRIFLARWKLSKKY